MVADCWLAGGWWLVSNFQISTLPHFQIVELSHFQIAEFSNCHIFKLQN